MPRIDRFRQAAYQLGLALVGIFVLIPIVGLVRLAFDGAIKGAPTAFRMLPEEWSLLAFTEVWSAPAQTLAFPGLLRNSLFVSVGAALACMIFGTSMAYAFARFRFPGRQAGLLGLLTGALLPPVALMTPLFILLSGIGLRTSLYGLMIVYTAFSMPFCIWNMRAAFQAVPKELEEAAFLDGATLFVAFWRVTLPLALPAIGVAALVAFIVGYSEFAIGWLFIENSRDVTLAMAIWGSLGAPWNALAAFAILMSLPVVALYYLLQRYLLDQLLIGAVTSE